jgi:hypothetical protein
MNWTNWKASFGELRPAEDARDTGRRGAVRLAHPYDRIVDRRISA